MPALRFSEESHDIFHHTAHRLLNLAIRATTEINGDEINQATEQGLIRHAATEMHERASTGLWSANSVDAAGILAAQQRRIIQIVCAAMASVSISAAACAIYWFWTMKRNYRRDLILMLILGDFYKSLWYLIHGSVNFGRSQVKSQEAFCQVSGYMLQVGLQSCDVAILFISMHMALQIFPPANSLLGHDGLYRVRRWVFAAWILIPCFTAALAFINPHGAYQAQGAFCWLPIRPFWYRLALSWVPRYLIWLYIMWVAIRIYTHVGYEFRVFGQERDRSSSADLSAQSSVERGAIEQAVREHRSQVMSGEKLEDGAAPDDKSAPQPTIKQKSPYESSKSPPGNANRRLSLPAWHSPFGGSSSPGLTVADGAPVQTSLSNPTSRRGSRQIAPGVTAEDFMAPPGFDLMQPRTSISSMGSLPPSLTAGSIDHTLPPIAEAARGSTPNTMSSGAPTSIGDRALRQRRRAIQRQLRILFIYPVVYILLWLIPFVSHCMSYSDHYAQHPIFAISLLSSLCQSFMGFADVCVFCWRERPWRHVPHSDGTFIGSFVFWTKDRGPTDWGRRESRAPSHLPESEKSQTRLLGSLKRWSLSRKGSSTNASSTGQSPLRRPMLSQKRAFSGGAGRQREAELAHERLKLERADYERNQSAFNERRESVKSQAQATRKEWFDNNMSEEILDDTGESGSQSRS